MVKSHTLGSTKFPHLHTCGSPRPLQQRHRTGWRDWEHGELWLGSSGILRCRLGWLVTFAGTGLAQDVVANETDPLIQQSFTDVDIERIVEQGGRWVRSNAIKAAQLRAGLTTGRLRLELDDGGSIKFLWAKSNLTYDALRTALTRWLAEATGTRLDSLVNGLQFERRG